MTVIALLERENFLQVPDSLCGEWGVTDDRDIYRSTTSSSILK